MCQKQPIIAVGAFIFNNKGEIFLIKSPKWGGRYVIPGGHVELGETLEDALIREVKEESNLDIRNPKFLTFIEHIYNKEFSEKKHFIFFDFTCNTNSKIVTLNEEATDYIWIKPLDALKLPLVSSVRKPIEMYLLRD